MLVNKCFQTKGALQLLLMLSNVEKITVSWFVTVAYKLAAGEPRAAGHLSAVSNDQLSAGTL